MGKAAYGMRQWNTSIECFSRCLALNDSNQQAKLELERSKERLHESLTGEISLTKLHDNFESKKDIRMDVADYVNHDKIEVKDLGAKFFLRPSHVGQRRAACVIGQLKDLNHDVEIRTSRQWYRAKGAFVRWASPFPAAFVIKHPTAPHPPCS